MGALRLVAEQEDWPDWSAVPTVGPELDLANCGKMRVDWLGYSLP